MMIKLHAKLLFGFIGFLIPTIHFAQAPDLGVASSFALFTGAGQFANTGAATVVTGDVGTDAGAFMAFPPGTLIGMSHVADPTTVQAKIDVDAAYMYLDGITCDSVIGNPTLGNGQVLTPDVYCIGEAASLNGDLILDGGGCDADAFFLIQIDGALSTNTNSRVILTNGASLCNVFWQINGAVALGTNSDFRGTILANGAISLADGASLSGRGLTTAGAISLSTNIVAISSQSLEITCPPDTVIDCMSGTDPMITGMATAMDTTNNCGVDSIRFEDVVVAGACPNEDTTFRMWIAVDRCGNADSCTQVILSIDTIAPIAENCPTGSAIDCNGAIPIIPPTYSDNCSLVGAIDITMDTTFFGGDSIAIQFFAADECGNVDSSCTVVFVCQPDICAPPIIACPDNVEIDCDESTDPANTGVPIFIANCGLDTLIFKDSIVAGGCPNEDTIFRTFVVIDLMGDSASCTQVITRIDAIAPVIICPPDTVIDCDADLPVLATLADFIAAGGDTLDNCGIDPLSFALLDSVGVPSVSCPALDIITRRYTVADLCGNLDTCTFVVTFQDTVPPVIPMVGNVDTVNCGDLFDIVVPASAEDNCVGSVNVENDIFISDSICPGNYNIIIRSTASDSCGNMSELLDTIVVQDTEAPIVISCPPDTTIDCTVTGIDTMDLGLPTVTDRCDTMPEITFRDDSTGFGGMCVDGTLGTITRIFFVTDACGNVDSSCTQTITMIDTIAPVVLSSPGDTTISCDAEVPVLDSSVVMVMDNCSDALTFLPASSIISGECANTFIISQSLQILDRCGNDTTVSRTIIVTDTTAPQPVNCPPISVIICDAGDPLPIDIPSFTDNCSPDDSIVITTEIDTVGTGTPTTDDDTIFVHFFATDQCGNVDSSCTQIFLCLSECPSITCQGDVRLDLGPDCMVEITADMILTHPLNPILWPYCEITLENEFGGIITDNILDINDVGRTFYVTIRCQIPGCAPQVCRTTVTMTGGKIPVFSGALDTTVWCIDPLLQLDPSASNYPFKPTAKDPCTGKTYTPKVQPDWVMPISCDEANDTAEIIFRTWEVLGNEGNLYTLTDTIVVFRLPKLTPQAFVNKAEDSFYCELVPVPNDGESLKRYASWKQPVGLHAYELPYTKLRGVTYEIPATIIVAGLINASSLGGDVLAEYLKCVIMRKADGTEVNIGDIVSGDYMDDLISNATPQQLGYGFLQALIELNEKPINVVLQTIFKFYPYLLLQSGDWILSEGGNFEQVDAEWFYNGNGSSPYWFVGGWPSIYSSGDCVSYCDSGKGKDLGCIRVQLPRLTVAGFDPQICDTICLATGTHCGITIKQEPLSAWTQTGTAGSCPQTRGIDTWITQTCWAETLNPCVEDGDYCEEVIVTPEITIRAREDFPGAIVDYECTDKAIKIHLSQWQTLYDTLGPIFDFCYPAEWNQTEVQSWIRTGTISENADSWERNYPTTYRVGTHDCIAEIYVPSVKVIDNCSGVNSVKAMIDVAGGTRAVALTRTATETKVLANGDTCYIYTYSHTVDPILVPFSGCNGELTKVRYEAADNCWNQSTWNKYIKIRDDVPPTVVMDRAVTIPLQNKIAWAHAETFDEGSWDNCANDLRLARRADWWADTACVNLCDGVGPHAPYDNWVDLLDDLGVDRNQATTAVGGGTVGESLFNGKYNVADLKTVLNKGEVEDYYYNQIVWLWEDSELCGKKVVHGWLYSIAANIAENCSATDEHGNVLKVKDLEEIFDHLTGTPGYGKEMAYMGGGWSKSVPFKCEDACEEVTVELIVFDYCCNWGKGWSTAHVEDKGNARLVKSLPDLDLTCEAYNSFYKDIVENAAALGENGSESDFTGVFAELDAVLGRYVKTWVDNQNHPTDIDGNLLTDSVLNFGYHSISCAEKSETAKIAVEGHDGTIEWVNQVTKTTYLDTTNHTGMNGIIGINCAASCVQDVWVDLDECGQGTITRRFHIKGGCGPNAPEWTEEQVIYVASACGMRESMFNLPPNVGTKDAPICLPQGLSSDYLPDTIGAVTLRAHLDGALCNSIAIGSEVKELEVLGNAGMKKYTITWTVIDWCASHTSSTRQFVHTQEVIATIDPSCDVTTDTTVDVSLISGHIMTELQSPVTGVEVRSVLGQGSPLNVVTTESGDFSLSIDKGLQVSIIPGKNTGFSNGVSTADLIDIQRHVLQKKALDSKYKLIAADVNGNGRIEGLDVLELRKLVLNPSSVFANNTSWRFYNTKTDKEVYEINPLTEDQTVNFTGVKIGDVNLSGDPARSSRSTKGQLNLNLADKILKGGEVYRVEVRSDNFEDIRGLQYTLSYADAYVSVESIEPGVLNVTKDNYLKYAPGVLTASWNEAEGVSVNSGEVLFTIVLKAKTAAVLRDVLSLNNRITPTEAYDAAGGLKDVSLRFDGSRLKDETEFALYQNTPNPYKGETMIGFKLPQATAATMTIYDVTGRMITRVEGDYDAGYNEVRVKSSDIGTTGVLYYQLDTDHYTATKKMILIN